MNEMTQILIVEDEATLAEALAENLTQEGYRVTLADNGEKALELIRNNTPDLVVLDIMLPILDGLSVCRIVRKDPKTAEMRVMMLTARGSEVDKIIGLESGADDYLVKPFGRGEFLARVRALLRRTPGLMPNLDTLVAGDLVVEIANHRVFRARDEVTLSNKEFDLLVTLMKHQSAVLSRDLLLAKVWGEDYYGDKRTVDVHIRWLREKIELEPAEPRHIVTVRGIGYRFEA